MSISLITTGVSFNLKTISFLVFFAIISTVGFFEVAFAQSSENQGGTITIDSGVTVTLDAQTFDNMGTFINNGILTITDSTTFNNLSPFTFQNGGTTNNDGTVNNSGVFDNTGTFNNVGTFNLLCGGTVTGTGTFTGNPIVDLCEPADTTPPTVTPPADITVEATSSSGAVVNYPPATATDDVEVTVGPTCTPASGSTFVIGDTIVTCTAEDAAGNIGSATFTISVTDTTPPTITSLGDFNGDGYSDLAVGVPGEDGSGAVHIIYGSASGLHQWLGQVDKIFTQNSPGINDSSEAGDLFGDSISTADFNGDGYSDLAVGVPGEDGSGAAHIIYGSASGLHQWLGQVDKIFTQNSPGIDDSSEAGDLFGSLG